MGNPLYRERAAPPGRHAGLPRGRAEAVAEQLGAAHGGGAPQTTEVERGGRPSKPLPGGQLPAAHGPAGHRKDAPGPDHCGEAARAGRGGAPGVQDALLRAEPGAGGADGRPLGAQVRARGQRAKAGLAGGGGDHAAGHGALGGPGLRGAESRREVPAAGRLPAVAGRATLEQAKARLKELYPSKPGWPDTTLVISRSKRMAVNAAANRALAPEASKLLELETQVIHIDLGETQNGCDKSITQNSPQSMRVWPGLRLTERYPRASLWPWRKWSRTE